MSVNQTPLWQGSRDTRAVLDSSVPFSESNRTVTVRGENGETYTGTLIQKFQSEGVNYSVIRLSNGEIKTVKMSVLLG